MIFHTPLRTERCSAETSSISEPVCDRSDVQQPAGWPRASVIFGHVGHRPCRSTASTIASYDDRGSLRSPRIPTCCSMVSDRHAAGTGARPRDGRPWRRRRQSTQRLRLGLLPTADGLRALLWPKHGRRCRRQYVSVPCNEQAHPAGV